MLYSELHAQKSIAACCLQMHVLFEKQGLKTSIFCAENEQAQIQEKEVRI